MSLLTCKAPRTNRGIETPSRFRQHCQNDSFTSLIGITRGTECCTCPASARPQSPCAEAHAFQATNTEARPIHQHRPFAVRLPVSESSYWQALFVSGLSCLSYSPPAFSSQQVAAVVRLRVLTSPSARSTRQRTLHDGRSHLAPPRDSHPFSTVGLVELVPPSNPRSVSVAPLPLEGHRIELEDYSSFEVLLSRASVEPDKRLSSHPARRDSPVTVGKTVPLAKLIRPGLAGGATHK